MNLNNNKLVPALRFKGFDNINSKTLNLCFKTGNIPSTSSTNKGDFIFFDRSNNFKFINKWDQEGEYIIASSECYLYFYYINGKFSHHSKTYRINFWGNIKYLLYFLESKKKYIMKEGQGSSVKRFNPNLYNGLSTIHLSILEQQKIAKFFSLLDKQIELYEKKLSNYELVYKYYLNKMFASNNGYPKLRFKGFDSKWEKIFLQNIVLDKKINTICNNNFLDAPSISRKKYSTYVNQEFKLAPENSIIFIKDGSNSGTFYFSQYDTRIASTCDYITTNKNNIFLFYFLENKSEYIKNNLLIGETIPHLYKKELIKINIFIPSSLEQQKIAKFFSLLDKQIELYERKLSNYELVYKYYLNKMFASNNGYPKLRFKGFDGEWEEDIIENLFYITRGNVLDKKRILKYSDKNIYPVYSSQTLNNGLMGYFDEYLFENSITWTTDGAKAGTVKYRDHKFYCTNVCGVLYEKKIKPSLSLSLILNKEFKKYVIRELGNPKLMNNVVSKINVNLPKNRNEIIRLDLFFEKIDLAKDKIKQVLIQLNNQKKYYLSKLFV